MRKNKMLTMLTMALLLCCSVALSFAATVELRQTGQTSTYSTGDDASKMRGVAWPNPRFSDNDNGTVTDNLTGLVWLGNANCLDTVGGVAKDPDGHLSWANALTWSNNLADGDCDLTDGSIAGQWRLPTVNELQSLVNARQSTATWLNSQGFTNVQLSYWSSTTCAFATIAAWDVSMSSGAVSYLAKDTGDYEHVWPVRAGQ
jgi:hypothetical protein